MVRFRADGEFLRAELPEGLGRTQALLVLQTEETVSSLLNEGRLVADAPDTLPATLTQAIAGVPLREIPAPPGLPQRDGIHYLEPDARSERWAGGVAFRSPRRCPLPPVRPGPPRSPFACFT